MVGLGFNVIHNADMRKDIHNVIKCRVGVYIGEVTMKLNIRGNGLKAVCILKNILYILAGYIFPICQRCAGNSQRRTTKGINPLVILFAVLRPARARRITQSPSPVSVFTVPRRRDWRQGKYTLLLF
jgi:hypothetical protein